PVVDHLSARATDPLPESRIANETDDRVGESRGIARRREKGLSRLSDRLANAWDVRADDGKPCSHRLRRSAADELTVGAEDPDVGRGEQPADVLDLADEPHVVPKIEVERDRLDGVHVSGIASGQKELH